ncbi:lipolysis-stimulated lipoprotein receptor-like isoform X1 [Sinocyclocheilus anshuiensis]|uniref:lipolysis-stimulated lipoprotein receptor-like isoform X1 n=1 Tax=Sinocyclocheilus anshuiensis TaxID=1608454 RepID=UPI0007B98215|nr:PREDICTED: lipolysis-stimulated lipoprotein receptor-like isoform X1 [Sinocyclocheilus anshuiensis]
MSQGIIFTLLLITGCTTAVNVVCPYPRHVVILFQPVTLRCDFTTTATNPPLITWKYKSYCRDPIQAALNPSSADNAIAQSNPNYNPNIECADSARTVRIVASKQTAVTLGSEYQGRQISITNNADLNFAQTAWGDSGVYICNAASAQDLSGNGECYTELIVLERKSNTTDLLPGIDLLIMEDWLLVVLVVLGFLLLLLLIGICWCQCCPHTCCCYVSCPCCPERCCCPRALYEAGKMVKSGIPGQYAHTVYAPSMYGQPAYGIGGAAPGIPMLPMPVGIAGPPSNGYGRDFDRASSVGAGSQVPLLQDHDGGGTRSGYRVQADQDGNPTRVLYYMERELANCDPSRPVNTPGKYSRLDGMSEVSSLHDGPDSRNRGRARPPQLTTVYDDVDGNMSTISSVSQHIRRDEPRWGPDSRGRARSMENLDDISRNFGDRDDYPPARRDGGARGGRRGSDDEWSSSGRGYDPVFDDRRRRDYSPDARPRRGDSFREAGFQGQRSRSRDDLMDLERDHGRGGRDAYDDSFLREAMEKKKLGEQQRGRSRERLDSESERSDRYRGPHGGPPPLPLAPPSGNPNRHGNHSNLPPPPPPYTEDSDSLPSSKKSNLKKNGAVSRESLVV